MRLLLDLVPSPQRHHVELPPAHPEDELKVFVAEVLLQIAPVDVLWKFIVGGQQDVECVNLVLALEGRRSPRSGLDVGSG